jgi:hypothetical protein
LAQNNSLNVFLGKGKKIVIFAKKIWESNCQLVKIYLLFQPLSYYYKYTTKGILCLVVPPMLKFWKIKIWNCLTTFSKINKYLAKKCWTHIHDILLVEDANYAIACLVPFIKYCTKGWAIFLLNTTTKCDFSHTIIVHGSWHICEVDFWGFIHYNVQYALFIMI